jgi:hypothetical protein
MCSSANTGTLRLVDSRRKELGKGMTRMEVKRNGWEINIKWILKNCGDQVQNGLICLELWRSGETLCRVKLNFGVHKMHGMSLPSEILKDDGSPWRKRENYQVADAYDNKIGEYVSTSNLSNEIFCFNHNLIYFISVNYI